jgi:glycine betaine/proline transport system permease protein
LASNTDSVPALDLTSAIQKFSERNTDYYVKQFGRIHATGRRVWSFNWAGALLGPMWAATRGAWGYFWLFVVVELIVFVQLGRGLWGDLGADKFAEAAKLKEKSAEFLAQAETARQKGESTAVSSQESADNLARAAEAVLLEAEQAIGGGTGLLVLGVVLIVGVRIAMGLFANPTYEKQFTRWQTDKAIPFGAKLGNALFGAFLMVVMYPLTLYRFTASKPDARIMEVPIGGEYYTAAATTLEDWFDRSAVAGKGVFDGITATVQTFLETLELILAGTPWPVVIIFVAIVAWRVAGVRIAIFCTAGLAYLGFLGFWETSMITFALIGTASSICIVMGIPLGIWFSKSTNAYAVARPILDLMQTLPPFVYLIPIIAFFGTGRVPGVLATIIVGMPPVIRLTALGLMHVDKHVKEAARAFGASNRQVLTGVELPLAIPSIMTGVNQTILLCLAMVVIASLIGAKGLGQEVLIALQFVANGQGILAGLAILVCAMILDRIVQGRFQREDDGK